MESARERLLAILEGRTKSPISHREFLAYLSHQTPSHRYNEYVPLVNFYDWLTTYRGYFNTLPDEDRIWSPPPGASLHAAYQDRPMMSPTTTYHPEHAVQHPYRSEVDAAVAHYMTGALFSDYAVEAVQTAAAATTHPDVFLPALEDVYRRLTPEAARFTQASVYNINSRSRLSRVLFILITLVLSFLMIGGFIWVDLSRWLRFIPIAPLVGAFILLPPYIVRICLIRYFLGITERPEWDVAGVEEEGPFLLIMEPRISTAQRRIVRQMTGLGLFLAVGVSVAVILLPGR